MPFSTPSGSTAPRFRGRSARRWALSAALGALFGATVTAAQHEARGETQPNLIPANITLIDQGMTRELQTLAPTVGEMLAEVKAFPGKEDRCSLPLKTPLKDGMRIVLTRVTSTKLVERTPVPFPSGQRFTTALRAGASKVLQAGKPGERVTTFLEVRKDGELVSRKKIAETSTKPRPQIVSVGARGMLASRGFFSGRRMITMRASAYTGSAAENGGYAGRTASGLRAGHGVVAVDPRFIPLGTRLYIEGYGYAVAGDTGGAIKGNRIDLGHNSRSEALRFGRRTVKVLILN